MVAMRDQNTKNDIFRQAATQDLSKTFFRLKKDLLSPENAGAQN